jgi:SAM-dependent methyltransferase
VKRDDVLNPAFWDARIAGAVEEPHRAIYHCAKEQWDAIQEEHRKILRRLLDTTLDLHVLDVGCGRGDLIDLLPARVNYTGMDLCPRFIDDACRVHPSRRFLVGDMRRLPFPDRSFHWVVLRSIEGMIKQNLGVATWRQIEAEAMRVSDYVLLLNYSSPHLYRVVDSIGSPEEWAVMRIECDGGRLLYRKGMDGCHELYDLWVDEDKRLQGVGRSLVTRLEERTFGSVYGFTRQENEGAQQFYERCGYDLVSVPGLYRGQDGVMFVKRCLRDVGAI